MTLAPDGLPIYDGSRLDAEIKERIGSFMSGSPKPDDLATIHRLSQQRSDMSKPKLFDEARAIFAEIAALG